MKNIRVSKIVEQIHNNDVVLEYAGFRNISTKYAYQNRIEPDNPPYVLYFQDPETYNTAIAPHFFFMRVWLQKSPNRQGFLRDTRAPYTLEYDVPIKTFWSALEELYVMLKIADDKYVSSREEATHMMTGDPLPGHPLPGMMFAIEKNLYMDKRYPSEGYKQRKTMDRNPNLESLF